MDLHAYFDYGSPYAYLAWYRITKLHPEKYENVNVLWKPVSAAHIFKTDGNAPNTTMKNQGAYLYRDVDRWAKLYEAPFCHPRMPLRSIEAMRLHFLADQMGPEAEAAWMDAVFMANFRDGKDISTAEVLQELCDQVGIEDGPQGCNHESIKRLLIANTQEAYEAGAPGVPYFVLETEEGKEVFWGNDRLDWIEALVN